MGSLSSWYVLSAMGFYPVSPGSNVYAIGSPQLERVSITLPKGKTFTIATQNGGKGNPYIQSAILNGKTFDRTWISHEEILAGGTLSFLMGPKPNTQWGVSGIPPAVSPSLE
jgi:putative alpha-1,2-mannosidase